MALAVAGPMDRPNIHLRARMLLEAPRSICILRDGHNLRRTWP